MTRPELPEPEHVGRELMTMSEPEPARRGTADSPDHGHGAPAEPLRLGTRRSQLALTQSGHVADAITAISGRAVELVEITTYGDTSRESLRQIGGTGVFVSALRDALVDGKIDLAVHSLKDLPTKQPDELVIAAMPPREDPRDAVVARDGLTLRALAEECRAAGRPARVGTGAARRMAQLSSWSREQGLPIELVPIRGNVDTRIGFVTNGDLDAVVIAAAGVRRLGRLEAVTEMLETTTVLPAPGQGALAVECAAGNGELRALLGRLDDPATRAAVTAERALLAALEAGCSAPVGAWAEVVGAAAGEGPAGAETSNSNSAAARGTVTELRLSAVVGTVDGGSRVQLSATGTTTGAAALGRGLAAEMLARGAAGLMGERVL